MDMGGGGPSRARILFWLILGTIVLLALTVYLIEIGDRGVAIATVVAATATVAMIFMPLAAKRWREAAPATIDPSRLAKVLAANAAVLGVLFAAWWGWRYNTDVEVRLDGQPFEIGEGETVEVSATAAEPGWRGELVFLPHLENQSKLGDCEGDAMLHITPVADGRSLEVRRVPGGKAAVIGGLEGARDVKLQFRYQEPPGPKQGCLVKVVLLHAMLRR